MIQLNEDSLAILFADMAKKMADYLKEVKNDPEYVSQNKAYRMFGRNTVDRWKRLRLITPRIRKLQDIKQDYFEVPTLEQKRIAKGK